MAGHPTLYSYGFTWPEAPRWARNSLWISDAQSFRIARSVPGGAAETVIAVPGRPAGMDFDAQGRLLLATAIDRQLLDVDIDAGTSAMLSDLSSMTSGYLNDLVTGADGWTFVGDTGFIFGVDAPRPTGAILAFHRDHGPRVVARDVFFPNGMVIDPKGKTLFVSETFGKRISAFSIGEGGALSERRVHATVSGSPDGLCLDAAGCLWAPLLFEGEFVRIAPDGQVIDRIEFPGRNAIACTIADTMLFLCVAKIDNADPANPVRTGEVYVRSADAASAGWPRPS